jgi:hypothetical protein
MGIFDRMRESLGMQKSSGINSKSKGYVLGSVGNSDSKPKNPIPLQRSSSTPSNPSIPIDSALDASDTDADVGVILDKEDVLIDVIFTEATLGLQFSHPLKSDGSGKSDTTIVRDVRVHGVVNDSNAMKLGIKVGDIVKLVDNTWPVTCYDDFITYLQEIRKEDKMKPIPIQFLRPSVSVISSVSVSEKCTMSMSDIQKEERRLTMQAAADARATAWDRRVKSSSKARKEKANAAGEVQGGIHAHPEAATIGNNNAATQAAARRAKEDEQRLAASSVMTFTPHMSGSSSSGSSPRISSAIETKHAINTVNSADYEVEVTDDEVEAFDTALGLLLSVADGNSEGGPNEEQIQTCVGTVCKLIGNLTSSNGDVKFRKVRCENAAMKARVLSIPGGEQLLLAAGFVPQILDNEEVFFHSYNKTTENMARYSLSRLLQLQ